MKTVEVSAQPTQCCLPEIPAYGAWSYWHNARPAPPRFAPRFSHYKHVVVICIVCSDARRDDILFESIGFQWAEITARDFRKSKNVEKFYRT